MPNSRSVKFKTYYANSVSYALGDNDFRLVFGTSLVEDPQFFHEELQIYTTLKTLKILALSMMRLVEYYEKSAGIIEFDQERFTRFENSLNAVSVVSSAVLQSEPAPNE